MTVVLDTSSMPERERADAVHAAYADQSPRRTVHLPDGPVQHRVERLALGPGAHVLRTGGTPLHIVRSIREVRADAPEHVAIGLHHRGESVVETGGVQADVPAGQLNCVDMTRPYRLVHRTAQDHDVLIVGNQELGVSVETVRAAVPVLVRSPLYALVRGHLSGLFDAHRRLTPEVQLITGQATVSLVRALLTTAAGAGQQQDALEDSLAVRLQLHLDAHLGDPDLTVERVAAAHHISVRHLYNVWTRAGHDQTPAQWIMSRRLLRARELLGASSPSAAGITAVARECGFVDASHFSRRFRDAFGLSPREWRAAHGPREDNGPAGPVQAGSVRLAS